MKFSDKTILCNQEDVHKVIAETAEKWTSSILIRAGANPQQIDAILNNDNYGKRAFIDYLLVDAHLSAIKYIDRVEVKKYIEGKKDIIIGIWKTPEVIRIREGNKIHCQINLKYWQLL